MSSAAYKGVVVAIMVAITGGLYGISGSSALVGTLHDAKVMNAELSCPEKDLNPAADCSNSAFRSYFLIRTYRGGGFGGGGK